MKFKQFILATVLGAQPFPLGQTIHTNISVMLPPRSNMQDRRFWLTRFSPPSIP